MMPMMLGLLSPGVGLEMRVLVVKDVALFWLG